MRWLLGIWTALALATPGVAAKRIALSFDDVPRHAGAFYTPNERSKRLISALDWETTIPEIALGYRFDIVLRGPDETPMEQKGRP